MHPNALLISALLAAAAGCAERSIDKPPIHSNAADQNASHAPVRAQFTRQIPWAQSGHWIKADTHIHTKFSDGSHTPEEVAEKAIEFGCDAIAITDHADENLPSATIDYAKAITELRTRFPHLIVLAGLEWNIPPWNGDEHATVLVPPGPEEWTILQQFKAQFDDYHRSEHDAKLADNAIEWLAERVAAGVAPVVIYNHPSRKDASSMENVSDVQRWRKVNELVIGFEGGPGHQGAKKLGSYKYKEQLIDRWDPAVARIGDAWDTLLRDGIDFWGALATSDFHNAKPSDLNDRWPGQFSETWLHVPEPTAAGILKSLRAGSFYAVHGHIIRDLRFEIAVPGLPRTAVAGEVVQVSLPATVTAQLSMSVPDIDWQGEPNRVDQIELIAISSEGASMIASGSPSAGVWQHAFAVPESGIVLRARGRRKMPDGGDLMFYTNPIRIEVR